MKGLLIKDFALLKNQKKTFLMIVLMFALFVLLGALNISFIMGYLPFVFCIYVMSSISYDEFDNGLPFLMVLPTTRKQYTAEKYVFGFCMGSFGLLLAAILASVVKIKESGLADISAWISEVPLIIGVIFLAVCMFLSIMIPIQLKFGSEKGRLVLFGLFMTIVGGGYLLSKYVKSLPADLEQLRKSLVNVEAWMLFLLIFAVTTVLLLASYVISVRIMEKKEF